MYNHLLFMHNHKNFSEAQNRRTVLKRALVEWSYLPIQLHLRFGLVGPRIQPFEAHLVPFDVQIASMHQTISDQADIWREIDKTYIDHVFQVQSVAAI